MTDDISMAQHYRQAIATVCEGFTLPDAARKVLETALWNPPMESATTSAEVDSKVADHLALLEIMRGPDRSQWGITERMFATLARQLAYSEEANATLKTMCAAAEARAEQAESRLAEATRQLAEVEGLVREALRGWDDVIEDMELNGLHDDPHFNYRRQKEWIGAVEAKAGAALTKEPTK